MQNTEEIYAIEQPLMDVFHKLNIDVTTYRHEPVYTVEQAQRIKLDIPGADTKNLFVKDKKQRYFLITACADTTIRLQALGKALGVQRLHFARPEELEATLGVQPGSVTPFALINDGDHQVSFILDDSLLQHECAGFHPLHNAATTVIKTDDLTRFISNVTPSWHVLTADSMILRAGMS